jgi:hypothetical protein
VTGICLGYRPGSLRIIFTGSYSLPPSLVAIQSFNEGFRQPGPVDYGVDDQPIGSGVRDVNPMTFPGESDCEFRPPQRSLVFGVDVPDLPSV